MSQSRSSTALQRLFIAARAETPHDAAVTETEITTIRQRLEEDAGPVHGSDLKAHLDRDAVLVVAPSVALLDCAMALATDDAAKVAAWLADATLRRPTQDERAAWPVDEDRRWVAVIVRPFVLVQDPPT